MDNNELMHYGVPGMKWGVRRTRNKSNTMSGYRKRRKAVKSTTPLHDDYKRAHDNKSVKTMSDKELRDRLNRLDMEQRYSKLSPSNTSKGKSYINKVIKTGTTVATVTTTALTIYNNFDKIKKIVGN